MCELLSDAKKNLCTAKEYVEDTKGIIRIRKSKKNRQHNDQKKKTTKGQTTIYKTKTYT
jgi:hypothetical protein